VISFDEDGTGIVVSVAPSDVRPGAARAETVSSILRRIREHLKWDMTDQELQYLGILVESMRGVSERVKDLVTRGEQNAAFASPGFVVTVARMEDVLHDRKIHGVCFYQKGQNRWVIGVEVKQPPYRAVLAFWHEVVHLAEMLAGQKHPDHQIHSIAAYLLDELIPALYKKE